jgi:hypothetical protein
MTMKFKTMMIIKAIICLVFFPIMLFFPEPLFNFLGCPFGAGAAFLARIYGASIFGIMLLAWFGRNAGDDPVRKAIVLDAFFYDLIAFVVVLVFYLNGTLNMAALGVMFIYLFLTVGFGIFLFPQKSK